MHRKCLLRSSAFLRFVLLYGRLLCERLSGAKVLGSRSFLVCPYSRQSGGLYGVVMKLFVLLLPRLVVLL
jgi:hypothetical protein